MNEEYWSLLGRGLVRPLVEVAEEAELGFGSKSIDFDEEGARNNETLTAPWWPEAKKAHYRTAYECVHAIWGNAREIRANLPRHASRGRGHPVRGCGLDFPHRRGPGLTPALLFTSCRQL